jgi:protein-tyrosine phosphatase
VAGVDLRAERSRNGGLDRIPVPGSNGSLWLCGKHLIGADHEVVIERSGASLVVCLTERHELADRFPAYVAWLDSCDPRAHWTPVHDLGAPDIEITHRLVATIDAMLAVDADVLVHCGAGIGRAGTVAAAVLVGRGHDVDEAIDHVGHHRPGAGPEAGAQRQLLESLAEA